MHDILERLHRHTSGKKLPAPVSAAAIAEAEKRLGFSLPTLLRDIYGTLSDGGFGPGDGLLPLLTEQEAVGRPYTEGDSVVHLYAAFRAGDAEHQRWPERLLPILEWGCAIWSCVDCTSPSLPVFRHAPDSSVVESPTLEQWFSDWITGRDLWNIAAR